ncbi:MAG: GMC family oxidoreductase [Candidatus Promineifilaceae bacterium]
MSYDYIIVGAGSAGCILANRLSASGTHQVLLLEAGGSDKKQEVRIPAAFSKLFQSEVDWNYETEAQTHAAGRKMFWPRGKMIGGCSSMNAMIYQRGNPADYRRWQEAGNEEWGWDDVLPYFIKSQNQERGGSEFHGTGGGLNVADVRSPNPLSLAFVEATKQAKLPTNDDFNDGQQEGFGMYQVTQSKGARHSAAFGFLKPAMKRTNLTTKTGAQVTRALFDGKTCTGVAYVQDGKSAEIKLNPSGEVIFSGGAINSPQLLMLSGIGDAAHLQEMGITPVVDLPGVGQNLQDHLAIAVAWHCKQKVSLAHAESVPSLLNYLIRGRGPLTSNVGEAGGFIKIEDDAHAPDLQFHFAPVFFLRHGLDSPQTDGFTIAPTLVDFKSRGYIKLKSADPLAYPEIQPNYLQDEGDVKVLVEGVKLARKIGNQPAFQAFRGDEHLPGGTTQSDAEIEQFVREKSETLYHPVGTCKMGVDPLAVVSPELKVHGVSGLRVIDASVMPTIVNANTNAPTMMIAEKGADMILNG